MATNAQSIYENSAEFTRRKIDDTDAQRTLGLGPGRVHRGGGGVPWHKRLALTAAPSPAAHHVLLILGSFVSSSAEEAWPSKATLASMSGRSPRVVQRCLSELKAAGLISVRLSSGNTSHYRLTTALPETPASPPLDARVSPPQTPASPKVPKEGTREVQAAATTDRTYRQLDSVRPPAPLLPILLKSQGTAGNPAPTPPDRHTCPCGHSWPARYDTTCYACSATKTKRGAVYNAGMAAPVKGKYDFMDQDDAPRPDPPPMKPSTRRQLESDARANGYVLVAGVWMRWGKSGEPQHLRVPT